jgi:hypothetical protein
METMSREGLEVAKELIDTQNQYIEILKAEIVQKDEIIADQKAILDYMQKAILDYMQKTLNNLDKLVR